MQEKLAGGMKTVQDAGHHLKDSVKDRAVDMGHDLNDKTHRLLPGRKPSRRTRIKNRAKQGAPKLAGAAVTLLATALVRRAQRAKATAETSKR